MAHASPHTPDPTTVKSGRSGRRAGRAGTRTLPEGEKRTGGDQLREASPSQRSARRGAVWAAVVLIALTVVAYAPAFDAGYVWDDDAYVTENPHLEDGSGLFRIWFRLGSNTMYAPAVFTTFWIQHQLWGLDPLGYHAVNIAFHAACVLLLWRLLLHLRVAGAWLGAALFAVHPVMVESVAWVTELKNVQSGFFGLLALLAYFRSRPLEGPHERGTRAGRDYALSLILFALALLSKPVAVTLAPTILVLVWWKRGRVQSGDLAAVAPMMLMGLAAGLVAMHVEREFGGASGSAWQTPMLARILIAGRAVWFYAEKLVWPANLVSIYPRWEVDTSAWLQYVPPLAAGAVVFALWQWRGRIGRGPLAAALCFGVLLSPLIGIFNVSYHLYSFVADHFQYHAAPALLALFASGFARCRSWNAGKVARVLDGAAASLLLVLVAQTARHAATFHDEKTRCMRVIELNPGAWLAMNNLGVALSAEGKTEEALSWFDRALAIRPIYPEAHNNAGVALMRADDPAGAIERYRKALRLWPGYARARTNLAAALAEMGDRGSALREAEAVVSADGDDLAARKNLARILAAEGRYQDAERHQREAVRIRASDAEGHHDLGVTLIRLGRLDEAIAALRESLRLRPHDPATLRDLATSLANKGDLAEAVRYYEEALRLRPDDAEAHNGLGLARAWAGQPAAAAKDFEAALRFAPEYAEAHNNLGSLLASQGRTEEAVARYQEAVRLRPEYAEAHANLGAALASTGRLRAAVQRLTEAVRLEPGSAELRERLAVGLAQAGLLTEAIAQFERALELDPSRTRAREALGLARRLSAQGVHGGVSPPDPDRPPGR